MGCNRPRGAARPRRPIPVVKMRPVKHILRYRLYSIMETDDDILTMTSKIDDVLYISESSFDRQIQLLSEFASQTPLELVVWIYPDSSANSIMGFDVHSPTAVNAISVTTYSDGIIGRCTQRLPITDDLIKRIALNECAFMKSCDSLCVYYLENFNWQASVIFHEGVILVRDHSPLVNLKSFDFKASPNAPSWW